ncbi:TPA: hypothetical protein SMT83_003448 [Proteus mirabilis]|uniref:KleE stable inheritance protein n=1 Tax=Proteus mirabilis TaxID=584 RepID=UPI0029E9551B|nr:hypothetical protein [Proteus mirabilis]
MSVFKGFINYVGLILVILFPFLKWIISIDVFFMAMRAIYYWNDPLVHANWDFTIHFIFLVLLVSFVSAFKTKN